VRRGALDRRWRSDARHAGGTHRHPRLLGDGGRPLRGHHQRGGHPGGEALRRGLRTCESIGGRIPLCPDPRAGKRREHRAAGRREGRASWAAARPRCGHPAMAQPLPSAYALHARFQCPLAASAGSPAHPVCTEIRRGDHDARRGHASGGGFRSGPIGVQLAARQLSTARGLGGAGTPGASRAITRTEHEGSAFRLQNLSVELDDGTVVVKDADVIIQPGERVLLVGESGTGKTTLTRAIAGLWPWGQGNIAIPRGAKMVLMPQRPYIPLGTLRRAATYPLSPADTPNDTVRELMETAGLGYLVEHLDEEVPWNRTLSGGECQRLAFVRLLLHQPDIVVMYEATSALDPPSQA